MSPTTISHLFPLLPLELRLQIWESTITPRTVLLRVGTRHWRPFTTKATYSLLPTTSAPALLRTCHEAREVGLKAYTQAFSEWDTDCGGGDSRRCSLEPPRPARYLWVNFELDMIDIGGLGIQFVALYKRQIRRLKLECDRASTVGRQEFGLLREQLQTGEYERLREVVIGVRDDAWFPESWRRDGAFVEGWRLEVRNWEDGRGYTLLMERMVVVMMKMRIVGEYSRTGVFFGDGQGARNWVEFWSCGGIHFSILIKQKKGEKKGVKKIGNEGCQVEKRQKKTMLRSFDPNPI